MRLCLLLVFIVSVMAPNLKAQEANKKAQLEDLEPREAVGSILMAGLIGGILGLSTLSFYDEPQDNIRNISIGAGVGMIAAAIYMTYSVSQVQPTPVAVLPTWDLQKSTVGAGLVYNF